MKHIITNEEKKHAEKMFIVKLAIFFSCITVLSCLIIFNQQSTFLSLAISAVLGLFLGQGTGLQHELVHGALKQRKLNRFFGICIGTMLFIPFTEYRIHHVKHHMFLGTPQNNELFVNRDSANFKLTVFLANVFMLPHYKQIGINFWTLLSGNNSALQNEKSIKDIQLEYGIMALFWLSFISMCFFMNAMSLILYFVVIPIMLIALPIRSLVEIAEHFGCDTITTDTYKNSRVIPGNFAFWLTNGNNYHVPHHLYPSAPLSLTKKIYGRLNNEVQHVDHSYILFYINLLTKLIKNLKLEGHKP